MLDKMEKQPLTGTILAVDDTPANLDVVKAVLSEHYTIQAAISGERALKLIKSRKPDLILLDIMMPEMDGYEVCRRLKEDPETADLPVIFLTAKREVEDEIRGLALGAVDYITKPISPPILQERVKTHLALRYASHKLLQQNQQLLQERTLIENIIVKMRSADVLDTRFLRYLISPVEETAGDVLLATFAPDGRQLVLMGDFTGHGLPSAIGGPLITYILQDMASRDLPGETIFARFNEQLCARLPTGQFFAAALLEITADRRRLRVWNGALPAVVLVRDGDILHRFDSDILPLGVVVQNNISKCVKEAELQPGDKLYAFSDGVEEVQNRQGEMFGRHRLEQFILHALAHKRELKDLLTILSTYCDQQPFEDDISLVEITV
uniref:Putative Response regulator protein (Include SpoIIE domain) n=1 Tax=Magnetococcus massalia (strain MO-1) TaxID=451514 RepID=A0A1S7LEK4_MAGMO|nr:putative Response regulator protein (include SpoIIE domain) [Candidatus Magnetococcus massalia]